MFHLLASHLKAAPIPGIPTLQQPALTQTESMQPGTALHLPFWRHMKYQHEANPSPAVGLPAVLQITAPLVESIQVSVVTDSRSLCGHR